MDTGYSWFLFLGGMLIGGFLVGGYYQVANPERDRRQWLEDGLRDFGITVTWDRSCRGLRIEQTEGRPTLPHVFDQLDRERDHA